MSTSVSEICKVDVHIRNGRKQKKNRKRMSKSVSQILETDVDIRFRNLWNGFRHPFHKKTKKQKWNLEIRFSKSWNGFWHLFHKKTRNNKWNGSQHPLYISLKRMSTSVMAHMDYNMDTTTFNIQVHQSPSSFTKNQ